MRGYLARVTENLNLNIKMVTYRTTRDSVGSERKADVDGRFFDTHNSSTSFIEGNWGTAGQGQAKLHWN